MDQLTPYPDRLRAAASNAGIMPGDLLLPLVDVFAETPAAIAAEVRPVLTELARVASRPILTDRQVKQLEPVIASSLNWRTLTLAVGIAAVVILIAGGGGYFAGHRSGYAEGAATTKQLAALKPEAATLWAQLIAQNGDAIIPQMNDCRDLLQPAGGKACALPVWLSRPTPGQR